MFSLQLSKAELSYKDQLFQHQTLIRQLQDQIKALQSQKANLNKSLTNPKTLYPNT